MHRKTMMYVLVAAGAVVVGLVVAGTPLASLLPYLLLLACPLMMVFMMRAMGGHGDSHSGHQGCGHDHSTHTDEQSPTHTPTQR